MALEMVDEAVINWDKAHLGRSYEQFATVTSLDFPMSIKMDTINDKNGVGARLNLSF